MKNRAELIVCNTDGTAPKSLYKGAYRSWFSWSPDSRYLLCQLTDDHENADIWIISIDGKTKYNISRHPTWDWSANLVTRWQSDCLVRQAL